MIRPDAIYVAGMEVQTGWRNIIYFLLQTGSTPKKTASMSGCAESGATGMARNQPTDVRKHPTGSKLTLREPMKNRLEPVNSFWIGTVRTIYKLI